MTWLDRRARAAARRTIHQFGVRLERYKLMSRRVIRDELLRDPAIETALREYCRTHRVSELEARVRVEQYGEEIVPFFNVLSYYRAGYNVARALLRLLYRVSSEYQDKDALNAVPARRRGGVPHEPPLERGLRGGCVRSGAGRQHQLRGG